MTLSTYGDEPSAVTSWVNAWVQYMSQASAGAVPIIVPALMGAPAEAMRGVLVGMSTPNAGSTAIQNAITAFWGAMAATPASFFAAATVITPPPTLSTISASIRSILGANTKGNLPQAAALMNLANALHAANQGGSAMFASPPAIPIV